MEALRRFPFLTAGIFALGFILGFAAGRFFGKGGGDEFLKEPIFYGNFRDDFVLEETASPESSPHLYLWLNSGGEFRVRDGIGETIQGELPAHSLWREYYRNSNPRDTGDGARPQNIFRLLTKAEVGDFEEEVNFKIIKDNLASSPERNESNGLILLSRYQDESSSYYFGIRVDGRAVIKKKSNGIYHTLAEKPFFNREKYDREKNSNLLPKNEWIGLRAETRNQDKIVKLRFFIKTSPKKDWELLLEAEDRGVFGGGPFFQPGRAGIRTDFMDVKFSGYRIKNSIEGG